VWRSQYGGPKFNSSSESDEWRELTERSQSKTTWENLDLVAAESKVFLLGIWKNFDELEENMSMPELISVVNAMTEKDFEDKKFFAQIEGIDIDSGSSNGKTFEDIRREALGDDPTTNDIVNLKGKLAKETGFGVDQGLMYEVWDK
jgi:hypothetical protein